MSTQFTVGDKITWKKGEVTEIINVEADRMKIRFIKPEKFKGDERWIEGKLFINLKKEKEEKENVKFVKGMTVSWDRKGEKVSGIIEEVRGTGALIKRGPIKQLKDLTPIYNLQDIEKGKRSNQTVFDLIQEIKNKSIEQILKEASERKIDFERDGEGGKFIDKDRSYRGFVYERLWDICIKFGVVDGLTMKNNETDERKEYNTFHLFGNLNVENIDFKAGSNCWEGGQFKRYLDENIQSGNSGGYSDISFVNKYKNKDEGNEKEDVYFISVKYYEKGKDVGSYDIGKLCTMIEKHNNKVKDRNINILIFVKDKNTLIEKLNKQQKSSDIMMKYIDPKMDKSYPNIYDQKDLEQVIYKLKLLLEQYDYLKDDKNMKIFETGYLKILKSPFIPRFHQKLFIDKINELILKEGEKNILVGAIPRSGKSYIMLGSVIDYVKTMKINGNKKKLNFILVTPAPNETFGEYDDIYNSYIDFDNLDINLVKLKDSRGKNTGNPDKHNLFIVSKQMLGYKEKKDKSGKDNDEVKQDINMIKKKTEERIKKLLGGQKFDLILLDEAHFGMSTENAQEILSVLDGLGKNTPKMFVTATYNKPLSVYGINAEKCKLTWDINDVQMFKDKGFNIKNNIIRDRFGEKIYDNSLKFFNDDYEKIIQSYEMYPKPYLMTSLWDYQHLHQEKEKIDMDSYGFDMDKLFTVKDGMFENKDQMINMMRYYFGYPHKKLSYGKQHIYRQRGILPRIQKICSNYKCRTMQDPNHFTTQLWFLPYGPNRKIEDTVRALITLFKYSEFKDIKEKYHFYVAVDVKGNRDTNIAKYMEDSHNIKKEIQDLEKEKQKNIIVLAGARLQLGISLRNVDIVTLWNMVTSSDAIFQMLFRSMTEVNIPRCEKEDFFCPEKKYGFMVDLNPQRALTNTLLFGENLTSKKSDGKSKYELIADCINIDEDVFQDKFDNEGDKKEFVNQLFNKLYSSWDKDVDDMRKLTEKVLKYDEGVLESIEEGLRNIKLGKKRKKDTVQEADEGFDPGVKGRKEDEGDKKETKKEKEIKKIPLSQLAAEVISELVSLLNIFSLYTKGDNTDCILTSTASPEDIEEERQLNIVSDINELKEQIFSEHKEIFLEILNGRLGGNYNEMYDEDLLDIILDSILKKSAEKENNLYAINKLVMSQKKKYYTIREPDKLLEYINNNLAPKEKERKEKGEVFTPISIIEEMLDKLPKNVWSDHTLKWLDPAVGIGNFPICVYLRLMEGLKSWEKDEEERRKHIIENMLFMVEISKKSIMILNKVFCGDKYKLNIGKDKNKTISFLSDSYDLKDFDIIMANPPYNEGGVGKGGGVFWKGFVEKSLRILNDNGYLVMIHPTGWRKPKGERASGGDIWDSFKPYHLEALKISDIKIPHFPRVDYYVLNKSNKSTNTHVINEFQSIKTNTKTKLKDLPFIPHLINDDVVSILGKLFTKNGDKFNIVRDQSFKPGKADEKKSGVAHAFYYDVSKKEYVKVFKTYTDKDKNTEYISKPKIIMTYGNGKKPAFLYPQYFSKEMGGTANTMYQLLDKSDNKGNIMKFLDSKLIHFLLKITQFSESPNHKNEFKILNMITKPNNGTLKTDEDIYKYYGIRKDEKKLIDEVINHTKSPKRTPKKKQTIKGEFGSNPKYANFKDSDLLPEGFEPEPEQDPEAPQVLGKSRTKKKSKSKEKKLTKKKCENPKHPPPPCKEDMYDKNGCCYKKKKQIQTQKKKKGGRRKNKRTTRKRRR
tara:strand:- start:115 stop:5331 length:5217 start_codon:yes stop_codon:yes gene_type:complete